MRRASATLRCVVRLSVSKAFALDAAEGRFRALQIIEARLLPLAIHLNALLAVVVAEVKFRGVALKMLRADMVERADDSALEDREEAFGGICVNVAAHVFPGAMGHDFMAL